MDDAIEKLADVLKALQDLHLEPEDFAVGNDALAAQVVKLRKDVDRVSEDVAALRREAAHRHE